MELCECFRRRQVEGRDEGRGGRERETLVVVGASLVGTSRMDADA